MARKRHKLTPNQREYQKQLKLLKRRQKSWLKKGYNFGVYMPQFNENPRTVTKKEIERLKQVQFKNFTPEQKQVAKKHYEQDKTPWGIEFERKPLKTIEEIQQWIDDIINEILNPDLLEKEREGAKDLLYGIIENARRELGDRAFYDYLQDPEVVTKLKNAASNYIQSYRKKNGTDTGDESLREFSETLNLNRPLTQEQAEDLEMYGAVDFDYSDTDYD